MEAKRINWFGLAGGIVTVVVIAASLVYAYPWWQLTIGQDLGHANISPLNFNFELLGTPITIPLIWFFNLSCQISLIASAIAIIIYSVAPTMKYSKHLLGFAYTKPLFTLLVFVISLFIVTYAAGSVFQGGVPIAGSSALTLNAGGATVNVSIATGFTWVFALAVLATVLCIVARFYHKRIAQVTIPAAPTATAPPATTT